MLRSVVAGDTSAGDVEAPLPGVGSVVVDVAFAVLLIVPVVAGATCITKVNVAEAPDASEAIVQVIVPVAPTPGVAQLNVGPLVCDSETKVVPGGVVSVSENDAASDGPALAMGTR